MAENDEGWGGEQETVRIGSAGDIYVYKVQKHELDTLQKGPYGSIFLNIALMALATAITLTASLFLTPSDSFWISVIFTSAMIAFYVVGVIFLCMWYPRKTDADRVVKAIRNRAEGDFS